MQAEKAWLYQKQQELILPHPGSWLNWARSRHLPAIAIPTCHVSGSPPHLLQSHYYY